jgi:hypothetical protein
VKLTTVTPAEFSLSAVVNLSWSDTPSMQCPICKDTYLHLVGTGTHQDRTFHFIGSEGVFIFKEVTPIGRGSAVVTFFQGECGHRFAEVTRFHKGECFRDLVPFPGKVDIVKDWLPSLWRN